MWGSKLAVLIVRVAVTVTAVPMEDPLQTNEIIEIVNTANTTWKAGRNVHPSLMRGYLQTLVGTLRNPLRDGVEILNAIEGLDEVDFVIPEDFDAREKWSFCSSLQGVRDQGSCGSCWAVSAAAAFSDRLCIATNGSFNGQLSAQQLVSCCDECGDCAGGGPAMAWEYFLDHGLVTGGDYGSEEGCQPYTTPTCEHYVSGPRATCTDNYDAFPTPKCQSECYNSKYTESSFANDLHKVKKLFLATSVYPQEQDSVIRSVQKEIYLNGPMTSSFTVYEDFLTYKKGVYQHVTGAEVYGHVVKIIGWGEEDGTPYWLVANSWNSDWGDNGFFKIRRGNDECGFEDIFHGGTPDVSKYKIASRSSLQQLASLHLLIFSLVLVLSYLQQLLPFCSAVRSESYCL